MLISEILHALPDTLEWMVLFELSAIQKLTSEAVIKAMYHLPPETDLSPYSHVILTSAGRFLGCSEQPKLVEVGSGHPILLEQNCPSLYARFADQLSLFAVDEAHCLGLGELSPYSPVLLHIVIQDGVGQAQAIFEREPSRQHYELLQAVGVKFLGGIQQGAYYVAQFQNRLPVHIHAGILSHFSRTAHCNLFFLQHGTIDPPLRAGLLKAANVRIHSARNRSLTALATLSQDVGQRSLAMTCQPPLPQKPFPYGDLVPLGFVLQALNRATNSLGVSPLGPSELEPILEARQSVSQFLLSQQQDHLWAFHTNRLVTATDSALVLLGVQDRAAIEKLERFSDGAGGYYPQLWSADKQPGKMVFDERCRHWCQPDYATTCMVRALRLEAGLEPKTSTDYLAAGMAERSGLYFANPYLVDWMLARAICQDDSAVGLQQQLLAEVLASMNDDNSFGLYDVALSTALAILTMFTLGYRGRTLRAAQLRLTELVDFEGNYPVSRPFYSTLRIDHEVSTTELLGLLLLNTVTSSPSPQPSSTQPQRQIIQVHQQCHSVSLYQDEHRLIATALAALALSEPCLSSQPEPHLAKLQSADPPAVHPRYQCLTHCDYIAKFALLPYLTSAASIETLITIQ